MSTLTPVGNLAVQSATPYPAMDEEGVGSCEKSWNNSLQNTSDILLTPYADSFSGQLAEKVDFGPAKEESGNVKSLSGDKKLAATASSPEYFQPQPRELTKLGSPKTGNKRSESNEILVSERALNRLKAESERLERSNRAIDSTSPGRSYSKTQQKQKQKQKPTKNRENSGLVQKGRDGSVSWQKVANPKDSMRPGGAVVKLKPARDSEKVGRRGKKKEDRYFRQTGSDNEQKGLAGTCSICGQNAEPGSKNMCKGCMNRQKSLWANGDKWDGERLLREVDQDEYLYSDDITSADLGEFHERSASLEVHNNSQKLTEESGGGELYQRALTDLQALPRARDSRVKPNASEISYWEGNEGKAIVGDQSSSVESLNKESKKLKSSCDVAISDDGSRSDLSHSEIYTDKKPRVGVRESESRIDQTASPGPKEFGLGDEQNNVHESNSLKNIELKGKLQRAKTDSEIVRAVLEHEAKESQLGPNEPGNEDSHQRTDKIPGKKLKRKTSSQSVDTGRGAQHKKDVKTKGDKLTYGVENIEMAKVLPRGKGHGYKSRVEGSTVATFKLAYAKGRFPGESKRVSQSPSLDSTARMSNTSLATEKSNKKAFANLRSHTIIGGNMQRNRDIFLKKEKKREDTQQMPGTVDSQVVCETAPVANASVSDASGVNRTCKVPPLSLYEIVEESDESYDDSSVDEDVRKVGHTQRSISTKEESKGTNVGNGTGRNPLCADQLTEVFGNRLVPNPMSASSPERETLHDRNPVKEYRSVENTESNDENSRPFQGQQRSFNEQLDDQEDGTSDSEYLNTSSSTSQVMSSRDIYYDEAKRDVVKDEMETSKKAKEQPLEESPYHITPYTYINPHIESDDDIGTEIQGVEGAGTGYRGDDLASYAETDVDTGITTPSHRSRAGASPVRTSRDRQVDAWGQPIGSASNSSNESNAALDDRAGNWYTGGFFNDEARESASSDESESMYFNDGQEKGKEHSDDHDIYTGQVFSVAMTNRVDESELGFEGNKTLNSNVIPYELIVPNNNQNNSVRQQMIQLSGRPDSRELPHGGIAGHDGIWTEGYWWNTGDLTPADFYPTLENFSNNSNGKEADDEGLSCHSFGQSSKGRLVNSIAGSSYTEYDYDIVEESNMRGLQSSEMGYLDFPRYESSRRDMATSKSQFSPDSKSFLKDVLFFGDDSNFNYPTHSHSQGHGIYFTNASLARSETTAHVEMSRQITLCRDSQNGEEYYVIPNDKCNNNNNADYGEGDGDTLENWYTGSLKNEEEFKPVFEKEFNTTPVIWPLNQTKVRDTTPNYFYQGSSNIKPYVSEEDCDYACEQKVKQPERPLSPKPALLFKVGGIVIRNNVQDDADYAKNINMDLQEEPKPYVRYDIGEHNRNDAADGGTSYEKNIVYDDFTTSRPWEEDDRAPWRITRGQNCGFNMEKSLEGAYDIKKPDKKLSKENGRSWGGLVNSNINAPGKTQGDRTSDSGVVKYLGSYVTRWF